MKPHWCLTLALWPFASGLSAQDAAILASGSRVRVAIVDSEARRTRPDVIVVGTLESVGDSLIVLKRSNGDLFSIPAETARLYVSAGAGYCGSGHRATCVALGLTGGAAFGYGLPAFLRWRDGEGEAESSLIYLVTIPFGAAVGTFIGSTVGRERWQRVDLTPFLDNTERGGGQTRPLRPGVSLAMRISF